jgi:hypothetical protein
VTGVESRAPGGLRDRKERSKWDAGGEVGEVPRDKGPVCRGEELSEGNEENFE